MQKTSRGLFLGNVLLLVWSILCISIYIRGPARISYLQWSNLADWQYLAERIDRIDIVVYLADFLRSFAGLAAYSIACISLGSFLTRIIGIDNPRRQRTPLARFAALGTRFILGSSSFSVIFLTLSGFLQLTPVFFITILLIGFLSGLEPLTRTLREMSAGEVPAIQKDAGLKRYGVIFGLSIVILIVGLFTTSARISYDASAIYFSNAKLTALSQQVQYFTDETFVASVSQSAIQFTALIQLFGDQSARMLSWICGTVIIIFSLALAENMGISRRARTILLALLLTSTAFIDLLGDGKVDLISTAPAISAIYWMNSEAYNKTQNRPILILVGFLVGLACVLRPFNAFLLGIFTILFYLQRAINHKGSNPERIEFFFKPLSWIAIGVVGWGVEHLLINWMILGDPLAFLSSIASISSSSGPWDADPKQIFLFRLSYPIIASFRNTPQSLGNITPLFIGFLPALFSSSIRGELRTSKELLALVNIAIVTMLLWVFLFFTVVEIRYVFFLWIILFLLLAKIVDNVLIMENPFFRNIEYGAIVILLTFICLRTIFIAMDTYSPLNKQGNPQCYDRIFCEYLTPLNRTASPGDRILTLGAYRYYLRTDLFACSTTHEEYRVLQELSHHDSELFWQEVYRQGYRYIAYEKEYLLRHLRFGMIPSPENTPPWLTLVPIYGTFPDLIVAYQIEVNDPPVAETAICQKNTNGIWKLITP